MSKNTIKITSETLYEIEVNNGSIFLDMQDLTLPERVKLMFSQINKVKEDYETRLLDAEQYSDTEVDEIGLTLRTAYEVNILNRFINETTDTLDNLFGDGSRYKIFGDYVTVPMLEQFMEAILPHFEKANIKVEQYSKAVRKKYVRKPQDRKKKAI